jgi:hypothetical protein
MLDHLHNGEPSRAIRGQQIDLAAFEPRIFSSQVRINKKYSKRCLDWKMVDKFRRRAARWVRECTTWASMTHPFNVQVHFRPVVMHSQVMKRPSCIEMSTDWIRMKGNEKDVSQCLRNDLEARVRRAAMNWFPKDQHLVLDHNMRLTQWLMIHMMDVQKTSLANFAWVPDKISNENTGRIFPVSVNPTRMQWEPSADRAVHE